MLYGYDCERNTHHVYIEDGRIYIYSYNSREVIKLTDEDNIKENYQYVTSPSEMNSITSGKLWGMFSDTALAYEFDRDATKEPSLAEMTKKAIHLLIIPKPFQHIGIASPVFVDFHVQFEVNLFAEEFFQIGTGFHSHLF